MERYTGWFSLSLSRLFFREILIIQNWGLLFLMVGLTSRVKMHLEPMCLLGLSKKNIQKKAQLPIETFGFHGFQGQGNYVKQKNSVKIWNLKTIRFLWSIVGTSWQQKRWSGDGSAVFLDERTWKIHENTVYYFFRPLWLVHCHLESFYYRNWPQLDDLLTTMPSNGSEMSHPCQAVCFRFFTYRSIEKNWMSIIRSKR